MSDQKLLIVPLVVIILQTVTSFPISWNNDFCDRPSPVPLQSIQPEFHVSTETYEMEKVISDKSAIPDFIVQLEKSLLLRPNRHVVFLVHGYFGTLFDGWLSETKNALLNIDNEPNTVIVVRWPKGASDVFDYGQCASNTQTIADVISEFAKAILKSNTFKGDRSTLYLHCIGHSLGAHACGQAGRLAGIFDRVTGLDPAGPGFEQCTDHLNIDKNSADCVDNIHTDGIFNLHVQSTYPFTVSHYGSLKQWGHVDFYPNGGGNQPGCTIAMPWCSHNSVTDYFAYTIKNGPRVCHATDCYYPEEGMGIGGCTNPGKQAMGYYSSCHRDKNNTQPGMYALVTSGGSKVYC